MHEFAITQSMLELVQEHAQQAGASRIGRINLVIGELSGFVAECMQFYFDDLSKGTMAESAELTFKSVPTTGRCRDCGREFQMEELDWMCPFCQGGNIQLIGGNELFVESIEVD